MRELSSKSTREVTVVLSKQVIHYNPRSTFRTITWQLPTDPLSPGNLHQYLGLQCTASLKREKWCKWEAPVSRMSSSLYVNYNWQHLLMVVGVPSQGNTFRVSMYINSHFSWVTVSKDWWHRRGYVIIRLTWRVTTIDQLEHSRNNRKVSSTWTIRTQTRKRVHETGQNRPV